MKAIVHYSYGDADVLEVADVAKPEPADDEALVRVHASSLNAADRAIMHGIPYLVRLAFGLREPKNAAAGMDVAGTIVTVGSGVSGFAPGDAVYAQIDSGAFAEYAVVPLDRLAMKPANVSFEQAAAVPLAGNTAVLGLRDAGGVRPGHTVLVNGASGGVGSFAVQVAKALGAEVTGVCSTRNTDLVLSLGAHHVVDYLRQDFAATGKRYDVIFDLVGNRSLRDLRRALAPKGTLVLSSSGAKVFGPFGMIIRAILLSPFTRQKLKPFAAAAGSETLRFLTPLVEAGTVTPAIERVYPLEETRGAMRHLCDQHARGKLVIAITDGS